MSDGRFLNSTTELGRWFEIVQRVQNWTLGGSPYRARGSVSTCVDVTVMWVDPRSGKMKATGASADGAQLRMRDAQRRRRVGGAVLRVRDIKVSLFTGSANHALE